MTQRPFRFGVIVSEARSGGEWAEKARRIEGLGYATLLMPDFIGGGLAPLPALAAAAAATRTLRLGTYVLANDYRNPVQLARAAATLDILSDGRFELGLGAGRPGAEADYRMLGQPYDPPAVRVDRLAEALGIVAALLAGEQVDALGPHYPISGAALRTRPVQRPRPPLLVAGSGRRMLTLATRQADIVALGLPPTADQAALAERAGWLRAAAGERFAQLELNIGLIAVVPAGGAPPAAPHVARMGVDLSRLARAGSPFVLSGAPDAMCAQLLALREACGVSYIKVDEALLEPLAPVVERLTGR